MNHLNASTTTSPKINALTSPAVSSGNLLVYISAAGLVGFAVLEFYFFRVHYHPIGYLGSAIPLLFGLWRIATEKDRYQKIRIIVIVGTYLLLWFMIPFLFKLKVPVFFVGKQDLFPQIHTVGSLTFFVYAGIVLLFGKRVDCGWCCPCVTARETVGYAFRDKTPKNTLWWRLRHLKWITMSFLLFYLAIMIIAPDKSYNLAGKYFYTFEIYGYYASFLLIPFTGNRNFCRILCPFAGLWGALSVIGFYRIKAHAEKCTACRLCEDVCDMGIPIAQLVKDKGSIRTIECMGCGRCVTACPNNVLYFHSFWTYVNKLFKRLCKTRREVIAQ